MLYQKFLYHEIQHHSLYYCYTLTRVGKSLLNNVKMTLSDILDCQPVRNYVLQIHYRYGHTLWRM